MPLIKSTKKDRPAVFLLTGDALKSFLKLKEAFMVPPLLAHHNPALPIFLFTDASDFTISGIPHQQGEAGAHNQSSFDPRNLLRWKATIVSTTKKILVRVEPLRKLDPCR